jgi:hypothetical protein
VDADKIQDYLLSPTHPVGRFKAAFFQGLGYSQSDGRTLESDIRRLIETADALGGQASPYGEKYEVRGTLRGPSGRVAELVTVWIILTDENVPRLVTAYPGDRS